MSLILTGQSGCSGGYSSSPTPAPTPTPTPNATFDLVSVATGFTNPEDVGQPNDGSGRLFVVEQGGRIEIIQSDGTRVTSPFLDVTGRSGFTSGGETGLLGLAFHPMYAQNRRLFVNYTRTIGGQLQTVIAEFTASQTNTNFADATTETFCSRWTSRLRITMVEVGVWEGRIFVYRAGRWRKRRRSVMQRAKH
jgi:glucose/arabinose dehydrogenase